MSQLTPTRCRICGLAFRNPDVAKLIDPNVRMGLISQFCVDLTRHNLAKHYNLAQETEIEIHKYGGMRRLWNFEITSPELQAEMRELAAPIVVDLTTRLPGLMPASFYFSADSSAIEVLEILLGALKKIAAQIVEDPTDPANFRANAFGEPVSQQEGAFARYAEIALEVRDTANAALSLAHDKMKPPQTDSKTPPLIHDPTRPLQ